MKKIINLTSVLLLSLLFYSCQQEDTHENAIPNKKENTLNFIYDNIPYVINYSIKDSTSVIYDKNAESYPLLEKLLNMPNLAVLVHDVNFYEYFDNSELMESRVANNNQKIINREQKSSNPITIVFYEHAYCKGKSLRYEIGGNKDIGYVGREFNDIISSMKDENIIISDKYPIPRISIILFEHADFQGCSISFGIGSYYDFTKFNAGLPRGNWNDRVSSLKIRWDRWVA